MTSPETPPPAPVDPDDPHLPQGPTSRRWRRLDRLTILAFVLLLPIPAVAMLAGARPKAVENRPLYAVQPLSVQGLGDPAWFAALDKAIGDRVAFRPRAVWLRARAVTALGGSPNPAVVRGTGDWLFSMEELRPTCAYDAEAIATQLDGARAAFAAAGQPFHFVLAPDKRVVYPDRRKPDDGIGTACTDDRRPAMSAALDARATWAVNGWTELAEARAEAGDEPLYFRQDSHWTPTGALPAIKGLITSIDPSLWSDADVVQGPTRQFAMDLARQVGIPRKERVDVPVVRPGMTVTRTEVPVPVDIENARGVFRFTASGDRPVVPGRTAIVYDSFFGINMARIAPFFEESVWIHQGDLFNHPELGAATGPFDRVVLERVERGLYLQDLERQLAPLVRERP
jgi:hypothetical protein